VIGFPRHSVAEPALARPSVTAQGFGPARLFPLRWSVSAVLCRHAPAPLAPPRPYVAPRRFKLCDAILGPVVVGGIHKAPIGAWPLVGGRPRPVLCGDLLKALRQEAAIAVVYWWGVDRRAVTRWRRALGVGPSTPGTTEFRSAAKRGKPRPPHVLKALDRTGAKHSAETRAKMSAERRARGVRPPPPERPWTAAEDKLLAKLLPADFGQRKRRSLSSIYSRRRILRARGVPLLRDGRQQDSV
jgi:hypothetical protein